VVAGEEEGAPPPARRPFTCAGTCEDSRIFSLRAWAKLHEDFQFAPPECCSSSFLTASPPRRPRPAYSSSSLAAVGGPRGTRANAHRGLSSRLLSVLPLSALRPPPSSLRSAPLERASSGNALSVFRLWCSHRPTFLAPFVLSSTPPPSQSFTLPTLLPRGPESSRSLYRRPARSGCLPTALPIGSTTTATTTTTSLS